MSRRYAIFDAAQMGPQLDVTRGGIVLTTLVPSLGIARTGRCDVPAQDFESFAEFIVYGNAGTSISNRISIGVVTDDVGLSDYVGADEYGVGYRLGEGQIHHDGSSIESAAVGALGDVIVVRFTPGEAGEGVVTWYRNGVQVAAVDLPTELEGQPLFLACSLGSDLEPGDLEIMVNAGRDWFWFPAAGQGAGWWESAAIPGTLRYGDMPYITARNDEAPYVRYEGGITANRIQDVRGVHFHIWGDSRSQASGSAAVLEVLDSEGRLDDALGLVYRDQPASLRLVDPETGYDAGTPMGGFIVERIEATDPLRRKITLKGPLASFEVPMLRLAVRPDADENAVGHYYPTLVGPAFSCPVRLLNKASRIYAVDGIGIDALGKVRDSGRALDPTAPDFQLLPAGRELELLNEPAGTVTVDAAASGGSIVIPGAPDVLNGDGDPFVGESGVGTFPENWTAVTPALAGYEPYVDANGRLVIPHPDQAWTQVLEHDTAVLESGKTYSLEIAVDELWFHPTAPSHIALLESAGTYAPDWWEVHTMPLYPENGVAAGGVVYPPLPQVLTYKLTPSVNMPLVLRWRVQSTSTPFPPDYAAIVRHIKLIELPPPEDGTEDELEAEIAAMAMPLATILGEVIGVRCGLPESLWNRASAEAIDAATGFTGQGYWSREQVPLRDVVEDLLRGYTASGFEAADGRLTFARLVDPETAALTGPDITGSDVLNDPLPEPDEMPGLTCSVGCRRNEHVFRADELSDALPWAARPKLTGEYRYVRRYGGPLATGLEHARARPTLPTRLVIQQDAQDTVDHIGQLASVPRAFFDINVPEPHRWEVAQICRLYLPRWFKDNNGWRNVYITRITNGRQDIGTLRVWTRAPWEQ